MEIVYFAVNSSRRKTDGQLYSRVFGMNFSVARADDQIRLRPRLAAKPFRQIFRAHHSEQPDQRRIAIPKDHRALADNDESGLMRARYHAGELGWFVRKHAGKQTAGGEMFGGR